MRIATAETWYETRAVGNDVTLVHEPHIVAHYRCNMWHVRGRTHDLLLDSGMGVVPLRRNVALLADRPVLCVASHTHFDHIGAHHEFETRAVHRAEATILASPDRASTLADVYVRDDIFTALPPGEYRSADYRVTGTTPTLILEDGDRIDLGDRSFDVIHLPGHSPGSVALWEQATGLLFSGDVIYDGELIDDAYHSNVSDYVRSLTRLRALPVTVVHCGHYASFDRRRFIALIDAYLAAVAA